MTNALANALYLSSLAALVVAWVSTRGVARNVVSTMQGEPAGTTVGLYLYVLAAALLVVGVLVDLTD